MDTLEHYIYALSIDTEKAKARARAIKGMNNPNGYRTMTKEMIGEALIRKHRLFAKFFPGYVSYKKIHSKELQKKGVDYQVTITDEDGKEKVINVDLKALVGPDYRMSYDDYENVPPRYYDTEDGVVVEITQNGLPTNTKRKVTDYVLYVIADNNGTRTVLFDYDTIRRISKNHQEYKEHRSNNKSGIYIKYPTKTFILSQNY